MRVCALLTSCVVAIACPARAEVVLSVPRYAFVPTEAGTLRLDTMTGEVALCTRSETSLACTPVREHQEEIETRVAALEARLGLIERGEHAGGVGIARVGLLSGRLMGRLIRVVDGIKHPGRPLPR